MAKNEGKATAPAAPAAPTVETDVLTQELAAPFDGAEVKFKPQHITGNRALVVPFVDARVIQDRLDEVLGVMGWQDSYTPLPDGSVVCRLQVRLGAEWITKEDVGGQSEQPDEGDRRKAAFSDALKRAAVKFGIGRYLYRLKPQWVDYDPQKRQVVGTPRLPEPAPAERKAARGKPAEAPAARGKPASGPELKKRLADKDATLASVGLCKPGELLKHLAAAGAKAGFGDDLGSWGDDAFDLAISEVKAFEAARKAPAKQVA